MRARKFGVQIALAAMLLTAVLIANCVEPLNTGDLPVPGEKEPSSFVPPPDKGYIKLNISITGEVGRTILPDTSLITNLNDFDAFDIDIIDSDDVVITESKSGVLKADVSEPITLEMGTYLVRVFGKKGGVALAVGEDTAVIQPGVGDSVSIGLKEIVDGQGTGKFTWVLTAADTTPASSAIMGIVPLSGGGTATHQPYGGGLGTNLITAQLGGPPAALDLKSGYYRVEIVQERTGHKTVTTISALHVYQGFTSSFNYNLPNLKRNVYTVTYNYNDGNSPATFTTQSVDHGSAVTAPSVVGITYRPSPGTRVFGGWYLEAAPATAFTFPAGYELIGDLDLYARWLSTGDLTVNITDVDFGEDIAPVLSVLGGGASSISNGGATITIVLNNTATGYDSWTWLIDGEAAASTYNNGNLVFNTAVVANKVLGNWIITVWAEKDGIPYTGEFVIRVTAP